jgi:hypothetical protein
MSKFLTPDELVAYLSGAVSLSTLARWRFTKAPCAPPYHKAGSRVLYALDDVAPGNRDDNLIGVDPT